MQIEELTTLVKKIILQKTEGQTLELKSCRGGFPNRIYDTLSSFSNQNDGGIIIFGISEKGDYEITGVYDVQDTQKRIMEACNQMEPKVRALLTYAEIDGKFVVSAEIPGVEAALRPVFYKGAGRIKGSYIRIGDADELMSEYEIYNYEAFRKRIRDELRVVDREKLSFFNTGRVAEYLDAVKKDRRNLSENLSDEDIFEMMGITSGGKPTLAGVMIFSRYPQAFFPQLCITAVAVPGLEIGDTENDIRFIDNVRITGAIPDMIGEAVDFVRRNCRVKTIIDENGNRNDQIEYPMKAVREAILNALIHRDYSMYTETIPVSVEMYRDRIVFRNPGGLYGGGSLKQLGKSRPETRNPALANMAELLRITENRYSGIPTIRNELKNAGLEAPLFEEKRGDFIVTFRNNIYKHDEQKNSLDRSASIIQFCQKPKSRNEIAAFIGKTPYYVMKNYVQPLIESGRLMLTIPDKPQSRNQKFVSTIGL